ncbi:MULTISPECIES: gas vesicle protein GvpM [unclassified Haladaptatus]|uniref:gas vesicle protein GvpM n=1 Tax=unclassified Haladaptatus TaxID=2622732 RepID=UPI0023E8A507|nr:MULTISPECIES: gas vesicle protein [unclassified Haladaptatus]
MKPTKKNEEALADFVDVVLREGVVVQADLVISVADIPLVGIQLSAAVAGMQAMTEYGLLTEWDEEIRASTEETTDETPDVPTDRTL